jgi:hypothetical protein
MEQLINIKSYPKSINNNQCVGPCYKKNTKILHPIYLNVVTNNEKNFFCPTVERKDIVNGKKISTYVDECNEINYNKKNINTKSKFELLFPYIDFNPIIFLNLFYNINNFGDVIDWIYNNKYLPLDNKERVFNMGLDSFFKNLELIELTDNRVTDFIYELFINKYLEKIVVPLFTYITIDNKFTQIKYTQEKETNESIIIKTNYIKKNIITFDNITNFIKYFKNKNIESDIINTYINLFVDSFSSYIVDLIKRNILK